MRLTAAYVRVFAALRDLRTGFDEGLNVVVGENEAGKSTLFSAIRHTLLTPTKQSRTQLEKLLGRYFPRPDGTVVECTLELDADGDLRVVRRWGGEPATTLTTPDGAEISGPDADVRLAEALPVRSGTFATLFLVDQAQLDATLRLIDRDVESRDEIAALLRRTHSETGGVSVEAFRRGLEARMNGMLGRWDRDRNRPEGGRGIDRPWERGVGELLAAWYALQRARAELEETRRAEEALEEATAELDDHAERLRACERFLEHHREAYESLGEHARLEQEIETVSGHVADLRIAVRRWPVVEQDLARARESVAAVEKQARAARERLDRAAEERERSERRSQWRRAQEAAREAEEARQRTRAISPVDRQMLAQLREVERERGKLEAKLSVGELRATIAAKDPTSVRATSDGDQPRSIDLAAGEEADARAHRRIRVESEAWAIDVEAGEESFEELQRRLDEANRRRAALTDAIGAQTVEEATARVGQREAAQRELEQAERRLQQTLGEVPFETLREEFEGPAAGEGAAPTGRVRGDGAAGETASDENGAVDERQAASEAADAGERLGAAQAEARSLEAERRALAERYGTQDALEDRLAQARHRLTELEEQRASVGELPEGFASVESFLASYRENEAHRETLRGDHHDARVRQAELLARLPERTTEEVQQVVDEAERVFDRARRRAAALERLDAAVEATIAEQQDDPFAAYTERVAYYLALASEDSYRAVAAEDPLVPQRLARVDGPELGYELLSQGTRDTVALAVRLALAETALDDGEAPLLLDDPLVDMDPRRRAAAAKAITEYAARHQVVLFTCHPDHADLFPDAHRIDLAR
ncbi:MAG: AAA family ATPase [Spirochaetota bacterium]